MRPPNKAPMLILATILALVGGILFISLNATASKLARDSGEPMMAAVYPQETASVTVTVTVTPTVTPTPAAMLFMPWMSVYKTPEVELLKAWTSETLGGKLQAFLPGVPMYYQSGGVNNLPDPAKIGLTWEQSGPCASGQIFSNTLSIPSGDWSHNVPGKAPNCTGVFTATASMTYDYLNPSLAPRFVVNDPGTVKVNVQQGFDKCSHPDIDDMQVWWDKSPYVVFNLYIGGISYACKNNPLDAVYVRQLAEQGWWFIPTWVGPQAPCSKYLHKMSDDRDVAYEEGKAEANEAVKVANSLGLFGEKIIYYDLESYTGDTKCRNTVKAFIRGWTEQLHALGSKAGGYGASCKSYIEDWATNSPPLDDIWIAHWIADEYDPSATVWNAVCLDDPAPIYWLHNQRIRQYAGGHTETWGKVPLTIDSNVLEGEVTVLPVPGLQTDAAPNRVVFETSGPELRDMGLLDAAHGWLLVGELLLWTEDGGGSWREITPPDYSGGHILGAAFQDVDQGWVVGVEDGGEGLSVTRTADGGRTWNTSPLPVENGDVPVVGDAYLNAVDGAHLFVALKLRSGSSFSLGRLFASQDGGVTWAERELPLGEPVAFLDSQHGWTAGGAAGEQLYSTEDGGQTWQAQNLDMPAGERAQVGLPQFSSGADVRLPVFVEVDGEPSLHVYVSQDGGETWEEDRATSYSHDNNQEFGRNLLGSAGILSAELSPSLSFPEGVMSVDFTSQGGVWVIIQQGDCAGDKRGSGGDPLVCTQTWKLLRSEDAGATWDEITPSG